MFAILLGMAVARESHDIPLSSGGAGVEIAKSDPPASAKELGPVSGKHGAGCGMFGFLGDFENARNSLRNEAASLGANYVRMDVIKEPYLASQSCFVNEYVIRGVAFLVDRKAPAPQEAPSTSSAAPPPEAYDLADQVYRALGRPRPPALEAWAADVRAVWFHLQAGRTPDVVVAAARAGGEKVGVDMDLAMILAAGFGP